ncbi:hypothetical protein PInf_016660 [Phytophthora infestans]|nr:hypothetical protein PInf_016660 [Phytophthora infestans]
MVTPAGAAAVVVVLAKSPATTSEHGKAGERGGVINDNSPVGGTMVMLFCAIVGVARSAISVRVDESDSVDDLKEKIKEEKPNDFKEVDADKLQLFLAKTEKGAGVWLTEKDVMEGVSDTRDLKLLGAARLAEWVKQKQQKGEAL